MVMTMPLISCCSLRSPIKTILDLFAKQKYPLRDDTNFNLPIQQFKQLCMNGLEGSYGIYKLVKGLLNSLTKCHFIYICFAN